MTPLFKLVEAAVLVVASVLLLTANLVSLVGAIRCYLNK
jgi:hypothetical protein